MIPAATKWYTIAASPSHNWQDPSSLDRPWNAVLELASVSERVAPPRELEGPHLEVRELPLPGSNLSPQCTPGCVSTRGGIVRVPSCESSARDGVW